MKHKIIVVDDEYQDRQSGYECLAEKISSLDSSLTIDLDFVEHPNQLRLMVNRNHYSGAIVDVVLDGKWRDFDISKALNILGRDIPIAILSARWDQTNAEQIDEALKKPKCRTFLHWRDIDPNGNGQIDYAVRAVVGMLADHLKLDTQFRLGPNDPIRILHISDVQTGGGDQKNLKLEANRCADSILKHWKDNPPAFIAFTGDVAEHGIPSQYKLACKWIEYFLIRLGLHNLPARNLLYVPGNHDVNLALAAGARVQYFPASDNGGKAQQLKLAKNVQQPELIGYAYAPFRNFLSETCDCPLMTKDIDDTNFAWVESRFRHLGVIFYGINTAQPASAFGLPDREVNADALAHIGSELKDVVKSCGDSPPLVVGLGHHCPVGAGGDSAVENHEVFDKFFRGQVKTALFLHGHVHGHDLSYTSDSGFRIVRSCAATLTKPEEDRPKDSLRGFNLLTLSRENHVVKYLDGTSYGWVNNDIQELSKRRWVRQADGMFGEEYGGRHKSFSK